MKRLLILSVLCVSLHAEKLPEKPLVVVIPSYNNAKYYEKNLESVNNQEYENYRIIYMDDASPDGTGELVQKYFDEHGMSERVTFMQNTERMRALHNLYYAIQSCDNEEIILTLDGDDWFADDKVLQKINETYQDVDVWLTYGQYKTYPRGRLGVCREFPKHVIDQNKYRSYRWISSQLRTFYAKLFKKIRVEDLHDEGAFFLGAYDLAMMFPMLEMASTHFRFIPDVLYIYNINNPIRDCRVNRKEQSRGRVVTRKAKRYQPLEKLFDD